MTIDDAIKYCEEKAEELREAAKAYPNYAPYDKDYYGCLECASEHEQLADWLKELKDARESLAEWGKLKLICANEGIVVYKVKEKKNDT